MVDKEEFSAKERAFIRMAANQMEDTGFDVDMAWKKIERRMEGKPGNRRKWKFLGGIVVLFLGMGALGIWLHTQMTEEPLGVATTEIKAASGLPELILASGEKILLDTLGKAGMEQPGAVVVYDSASRSLQYKKEKQSTDEDQLAYNQLRIPKGGEYALILSDGSRVWLNAESVLRYPVKFCSGTREVYLEGEAYFEVASDKEHPFIVHMGQKSVNVLGTVFNVSAYPSDSYWHVTLVSGKVGVNSEEESFLLNPDQQYFENVRTGEKEVRKVEVDQYLSWRTGKIVFRGERLEDIIQKLERWFDFQLFYANEEVRDMRFRGAISKYDSFDTVLRKLEKTTDIRFEIKGNTVIVSKIYRD